MEKSAKNNIFNKIKSLFKKKESEVKEDEKYMDALQFFSMVKASSKESVATYRDDHYLNLLITVGDST